MMKESITEDINILWPLFRPLLDSVDPLRIEYSHTNYEYKGQIYAHIVINSVNGFEGRYLFKNHLVEVTRECFRKFNESVKNVPLSRRGDVLDELNGAFDHIIYAHIRDYRIVLPESEYGPGEARNFKSFFKPIFSGTLDDKLETYEQGILYEAQTYAEALFEVIDECHQKMDFLINQMEFGANFSSPVIVNGYYVDPTRIEDLKRITNSDYDFTKLIRLCEELNLAYINSAHYSVGMLVRTIIDHIPPVFGQTSFSTVVGSHGPKSFKDTMDHLDKSLRKIADGALHQHIRKKEVLPNATQVNFSRDLDVLLSEVYRMCK